MSPEPDDPVVLVVDDDPDLVSIYADWLETAYEVRTATGGEAARDALDDDLDVVFLDRRMPDLDGGEVVAEIRDRELSCRVAMVTAVAPDFDILDMGFDDYLVKPVSVTELVDTVEQLLTRESYDEGMREFFSLVSKKAVLDAELSAEARADSYEYAELEARIEAVRAEVDTLGSDVATTEFEPALRDLTSKQ